jgi:DNA-binding PadR family transcriptional regulator
MAAHGPPTTPDLVVLCLLAERPMHGYEVAAELRRRDVADWAGISRPQIYYSLKKLNAQRLIKARREAPERGAADRRVFAPTDAGMTALHDALGAAAWATQRPPTPFVTWMVLAIHASPRAIRAMFDRRRAFVAQELARERQTLAGFDEADDDGGGKDAGPTVPIGRALVTLGIRGFELELGWLDDAERACLAGAAAHAAETRRAG